MRAGLRRIKEIIMKRESIAIDIDDVITSLAEAFIHEAINPNVARRKTWPDVCAELGVPFV